MTEQEWLQATDPRPMLEFLWGKTSERKVRLFACACCRRVWSHLAENSKEAVIVAERFADGEVDEIELGIAEDRAMRAAESSDGEAVWMATISDAWLAGLEAAYTAAGREAYLGWPGRNDFDKEQFLKEYAEAAGLVRGIFGNPFRPVSINPSWLTWHDGLLVSMARQMYDSRDFTVMPILGDALEESGCTDQNILEHCRSRSEHVRGCWVVDLVLGKS